MNDATAASAGVVLAGVALAATLAGWPRYPLAAALALVVLVAFGLRRRGRLDRSVAAIVAGVGAVGVVALALAAALRGGDVTAGALAAMAGGGSAVAAYADWEGLGREALVARAAATSRAAAVGALGILAIYAWGFLILVGARTVATGTVGRPVVTVLSTLASGAGTVSVVVWYLRWRGLDRGYLDVRWPGRRGIGYAVVGTLAILGGNLAIGLALERAGIDAASHTIVETAAADPSVLLVLIPLSYLVIGPGEELLYRNVIQKALRETFSPVGGVVVASAVFAAVHLPAYSTPGASPLATLATLGVVFVLALVLGAVYERTGNVVVSALAHGSFNAIAFAATYAQLTGALGG